MVSDNKTAVETKNLPAESYVDGIDEYQDTTVRKVITKGDLWRCAFRGLFMEGNFNFERMQGEDLHSPSSQHYAKFMVITNVIMQPH